MKLIESLRAGLAERKAKKRRRKERSFHADTGSGHTPTVQPGGQATGAADAGPRHGI